MTDSATPFKDFDALEREIEDRPVGFRVAGEDFSANLNVNAAGMLKWMRAGASLESIPTLYVALLGEKEYDRLLDAMERENTPFDVLMEVTVWLSQQLAEGQASGN